MWLMGQDMPREPLATHEDRVSTDSRVNHPDALAGRAFLKKFSQQMWIRLAGCNSVAIGDRIP